MDINATMELMNTIPPSPIRKRNSIPDHYSYRMHRKQLRMQILFPVILSAVLMAGMVILINLATFTRGGDVGRWAALSTIWILIPLMVVGMILLLVLSGLIYILARALRGLPYYSGMAQDFVYSARGVILRGAAAVVKPMITMEGWMKKLRTLIGRIMP